MSSTKTNVCRDNLNNKCNRKNCKFRHLTYKEYKKLRKQQACNAKSEKLRLKNEEDKFPSSTEETSDDFQRQNHEFSRLSVVSKQQELLEYYEQVGPNENGDAELLDFLLSFSLPDLVLPLTREKFDMAALSMLTMAHADSLGVTKFQMKRLLLAHEFSKKVKVLKFEDLLNGYVSIYGEEHSELLVFLLSSGLAELAGPLVSEHFDLQAVSMLNMKDASSLGVTASQMERLMLAIVSYC